MTELVLIRGLPGSGKTSYAKKHFPNHSHYEADQWFMVNGEYKFDPKKLNYAHTQCQKKTMGALMEGYNVVVTNTFTQSWEFDSYLGIIDELVMKGKSIDLRVIEMQSQYGNTHGVPPEKLVQMKNRWHDWETVCGDCGLDNDDCNYEVVE
jgi:hypothetical protein